MNTSSSSDKREKQQKRSPARAVPAAASGEAHRRAAVILEVLAGVRSAPEAAEVLKISVNHYYLLERRALAGLVAACQAQPKGKRPDAEKQLATLRRALERSQRECQRQAALVRATQQALGVPVTSPPLETKPKSAKSGKAKRRRRATSVRALRAARRLEQQTVAAAGQTELQQREQAEAAGERVGPANEESGDDGT